MQELEKILEEIDNHAVEFELFGTSDDYISVGWVKDIIRKHMNEGWIPVEERLPEEKELVLVQWEKYDRYLNVMLTYLDVMWLDDAEEQIFETTSGVPNGRVIAWRPLPEMYHPKKE